MDRSEFYYRQIVTNAEMNEAFDDVAAMALALVADHTDGDQAMWGVFQGLTVGERTIPDPDTNVVIEDGVAYDSQGRRIPVTGGPHYLDLAAHIPATPGDAVWVRVYVAHDTDLQDPRLDGNGDPVDYRQLDSFVLSAVAGTAAPSPVMPAIDTSKVLLATVYLPYGITQITAGYIYVSGPYFDGPDPLTANLVVERQEGGVIAHGRLIPYNRSLIFEPTAIAGHVAINTSKSDIQLEGGDLRLDGVGDDGGGSIYMEQGPIYKAAEVRVAGIIQDGGGYWYGDAAGNERAEPLQAVNKYLSYHPTVFQPAPSTSQIYPNDTVGADNSWAYSVFGSGTSFSCYWRVTVNFAGAGQTRSIFCPLVGLPFRARIVECHFLVTVDTIVSDLEYGVSVWRHDEDTGNTPICLNPTGAPTYEDFPGTGPYFFDTNGINAYLLRPDLEVYFAKFDVRAKGAYIGPAGIRITGCRAKYEIREASGEYYHPTL